MCFVGVREDLADRYEISACVYMQILSLLILILLVTTLHLAGKIIGCFLVSDMGAYARRPPARIRSYSSKKGLSVSKQLLR